MIRRKVLLLIVMFLFISEGCAKTKPYNPFRVAEEEFYAKTKVIALAPVVVSAELDRVEAIRAKFDSLIETTLRESGLTIIPSGELAGVWKTMSERVGGVLNPDTGKRDDAKFKAAKEHTLRELNAKFSVDAVVYPLIGRFNVRWEGGVAEWHGVSERVTPSSLSWVLKNPTMVPLKGVVPALSLYVIIEDIHGVKMYENGGGIQLLAKPVETYYDYQPVPKDQLLVDEGKNLNAVKIALGPLIPKPGR